LGLGRGDRCSTKSSQGAAVGKGLVSDEVGRWLDHTRLNLTQKGSIWARKKGGIGWVLGTTVTGCGPVRRGEEDGFGNEAGVSSAG
jgi:hypothetical protein